MLGQYIVKMIGNVQNGSLIQMADSAGSNVYSLVIYAKRVAL